VSKLERAVAAKEQEAITSVKLMDQETQQLLSLIPIARQRARKSKKAKEINECLMEIDRILLQLKKFNK